MNQRSRRSVVYTLIALTTLLHFIWATFGIQRIPGALVYGGYFVLLALSLRILLARLINRAAMILVFAAIGYVASIVAYMLGEIVLGDWERMSGTGFARTYLTFFPAVFLGWMHSAISAGLLSTLGARRADG